MKNAAGRMAVFWLVMGTWTTIVLWSVGARSVHHCGVALRRRSARNRQRAMRQRLADGDVVVLPHREWQPEPPQNGVDPQELSASYDAARIAMPETGGVLRGSTRSGGQWLAP